MSEQENISAIEAYCKHNGWTYSVYDENAYIIKKGDDTYIIAREKKNGSFVIQSDQGPITISKINQTSLDPLEESLRQLSLQKRVKISIPYKDNDDDKCVEVTFNESYHRTPYYQQKDGKVYRNKEFTNLTRPDTGCVKIGEKEYEYEKTEEGNYILSPKDGSKDGSKKITITNNNGYLSITENGQTTHCYNFDLSCKMGDEEIIIPHESLYLTAKNVEEKDEIIKGDEGKVNYTETPIIRVTSEKTAELNGRKYGFQAGCRGNEIIINEKYIKKNENGQLMVDENECILRDENGNLQLTERGQFIYIHEFQHWKNNKEGIVSKVGLNQEDVFKLNMLNEVSATMAEVGYIYEQYNKAQTSEEKSAYLELLNNYSVLPNKNSIIKIIKNDELPKPEQVEQLARLTYEGWMKYYNTKKSSGYIDQAKDRAGYAPIDLASERFFSSTNEEYMDRVNKMFSDIYGLGNVSAVMTGDNAARANFEISSKDFDEYEGMEVSITLTQAEVEKQLINMMKKDEKSYKKAMQALNNLSQTNETNNNKQQSINLVLQNNYNDR